MIRPVKASKFLALLPALVVACLFLIWGLVSVVMDPYCEFNLVPMRRFYTKYETTPYGQAQRLKSGRYALVFGGSRSSTLNSEYLGEPTLNLSMSVYSQPASFRHFLEGLNEAQWSHVSKIYMVAEHHYTIPQPPPTSAAGSWTRFDSFLWQTLVNIDQLKILRSFQTLAYNLNGRGLAEFEPLGSRFYSKDMKWDWDGKAGVKPAYNFDPLVSLEFSKVLKLIAAHQIEVVVFRGVVSDNFFKFEDFESLGRSLREITHEHELVMMAWHPEWSRRHDLFADLSHHSEKIGAWEGSVLRDSKTRAAWTLKEKDVDAYLRRIRREISMPGTAK